MKTRVAVLVLCAACGGGKNGGGGDDDGTPDAPKPADASLPGIDAPDIDAAPGIDAPPAQKVIHTIFVIPFENKANTQIYGNTTDAPFINSMLANAAHATKFADELPNLNSEPHYVWMEAGTNVFNDHTFSTDDDASAANSTASTAHLVTQLQTASIPWMSYQEGITSGTCPTGSSGFYAAKHDPFVFFKDVTGSALCAQHHKAYADFAGDLANNPTGFIFITPNLCHDMHGDVSCPSFIFDGPNIQAGDTWLSTELPRIITYTQQHDDAVIFLTWDEGDSTNLIPFIAIGNLVKGGHTSTVAYSHSSMLKSVESLLGVPVLPSVTSAKDFADLFVTGTVFH